MPPPAVVEPFEAAAGVEWSAHACPKRHLLELQFVWPDLQPAGLLVVPVCQRSPVDLSGVGAAAEAAKEHLLLRFAALARAATARLEAQGHWADWVDPCSGLPMRHRGGAGVYGECAALATLRGFATANAGCCTIALHPRWGAALYPASVVTNAPEGPLRAAMAEGLAALAEVHAPP